MAATVPFGDRLVNVAPQTGITLGLYPSSSFGYDLQLHRAASTQGTVQPTSSQFSEVATLGVINGGNGQAYPDPLPLSKTFWWYKLRSVRNGYTPSAFTTAIVSQAAAMPTSAGTYRYTGRPLAVSVNFSTVSVLRFGTTTNPASILKRAVVPAAAFHAESTADLAGIAFTGAYLETLSVGAVAAHLVAPLTLPPGVTITGYSIRAYRLSTKGGVFVQMNRIAGDAAVGLGSAGFNASTTNWQSLNSSAMNESVSTSRGYSLRLTIGSSGGIGNARLESVTVSYRMSQYGHSL